jgi:hypothetical protein
MGAADGYRNLVRLLRRERAPALVAAIVCGVILVANVVVSSNQHWVGSVYEQRVTGVPLLTSVRPGFTMSPTPAESAAADAARLVPDGASATVQDQLLPHLSGRRDAYLLGYPAPATDYVVFSPPTLGWPDPVAARQWLDGHRAGYRPIFDRDGWVVWKRST